MEDWTKFSDEQVFSKAGEQPGSQAAYWRDVEIRRRDFLLNQDLLRTQIESAEAQKAATTVMKRQSDVLVWTAGFAALSAVAALATAVVTYLVAK
jgi:hypothetical protein